MKHTRGKGWAVFFSVIMVLSMVAMSVTLVGTVAAEPGATELTNGDVEDVIEGQTTQDANFEVAFDDRGDDLIAINVEELDATDVAVTGIEDVAASEGDLNLDSSQLKDAEQTDADKFDNVEVGDRVALIELDAVGSGAESLSLIEVSLSIDTSSSEDYDKPAYIFEAEKGGQTTSDSFTLMGGSGTSDDPYLIEDWHDLDSVRDDPTASYELIADLDENTDGYMDYNDPDTDGWVPLGDSDTTFTGTFNGQGHHIKGLYINRPDTYLNGLFGYSEGVIQNVGVKDVNLTGYNKMGGLAGRNSGTIETSYSTGVVDGRERTGGLVGHNENGDITDSYSDAEVISDHEKIGGLVGDNSNSEIHKSYTAGIVDEAGEGSTVGGLTGREDGDTVVEDSFWDTDTSGQDTSGGGTGKTTAEMQDIATFTDTSTEGLTEAWDIEKEVDSFTELWEINQNNDYPRFNEEPYEIQDWHDLDSVRDDPTASYELIADLDENTDGYNDYGSDWDSIGTFTGTFDGQDYIIADLAGSNGLFSKIDGATIENLNLENVNVDAGGGYQIGSLVGEVTDTEKSTISEVHATGEVSGDQDAGGLIGLNRYADVSNSSFSGNVTSGDYNTGGLVGRDTGSNSYTRVFAEGDVSTSGEYKVGGLIGISDSEGSGGTIDDSYATADVEGDQHVGGLIGYNKEADVTNSYSTGEVTADDANWGGLIGEDDGGSYSDSFWDTETSGQDSSDGGIGLTTAQMQDYNSFTNESNSWLDAAWDFVGTENDDAGTGDYWEMDQDGTVNDNYPILTWQDGADGALTVGADSVAVETQPAATQTAGEALSGPPEVNVTDEYGNAVDNVDVTVALNTSEFASGSTTTVPTNASGIATFDDLVVNTMGDYELEFDIDSADDNVDSDDTANSQTFEVESAAADSVSVTGDTTTAPADGTSELQYTATVEDKFGNAVEGVTVNATDNGTDLTYTGDGSSVMTDSNGNATFTVTSSTAQTVEFTFTEQANENDTTATGTFEHAGADSVEIQTQPDGTQTAGETLTGPPEVNITDEDGNAVEGVNVTVTEADGYTFDSGTTTQTTGTDGVATFDDLTIETADTSYQLDFDIDSADDNVTADDTANSQTFEVESADADSVSVTGDTTTATADGTSELQYTATVEDEFGNAVEGVEVVTNDDGSNISSDGDNSLNTDASGQVVVTATSTEAQSDVTFTFTEQANSNDATASGSFEAGAVDSVAADDVTVEAADSGQEFTVDVTDADGNLVDGETVAITANDSLSGISVDDTEDTTDGTATFSFGENTADTYTVEVALDSDNQVSDTLTVTVEDAGADSVAIQTEPEATQTAGEVLSGPPEVNVTDEDGNAVEGVDVTVSENGSYTFDSGTTTQTTGSDGIATFDDLVINMADTGYQLDFSIDSAYDTANSQIFEVESATADSITIQTQPEATQTANETLTGLPAVNVTDEYSNAVEGVDVTVALNTEGDPENFDSKSTLTVLTNKSGIATFDNLVVNTATGDYKLEFSVNPSVTSEVFSMEAAANTTPPEITNFIVNNTEGQTVEVSFDSDKALSKINSNGTDDADGTTLEKSDFTETGDATDGFTYTAILSEGENGTFGATLDTAEDANDNDGASNESDEVIVDTNEVDSSSDGSGGGGSSGGSGGGGSSGGSGGGGSSGNNVNERDPGDNQSQSVTRQTSDDGSVDFTVSDSAGIGDIVLSLTEEADDGTEADSDTEDADPESDTDQPDGSSTEPTRRNVDHDSLSVQPTEAGTREFNINVRQWDASSETNESTNDQFFEETGSSAIGYVEVTHSNSDDDIEGVTFQFRVRSAYLDEHDIESEDIALYRDEASGWNELDATEVETTRTHHVFEAESPGLSLFAVGAPDSTESTSGPEAVATVSPSSVTEGEEVTLDASDSTNEDGEIVAYEWSVGGETLTGETVTLTAEEASEYTVELTVTNDAGETDTTTADLTVTAVDDGSDDEASTETDDETLVVGAAGFAIYVIITLLVVVIAAIIGVAVIRRRSKDDNARW